MPTIGTVIINTRAKIPDLVGLPALPQPSATVTVVAATGSTLPTGTYACIVTQRNPYGETVGSTETTGLVVGANQGIQIVSTLLPGAVSIRAYLTIAGGSAGSEVQWTESSSSPFIISTPPTGQGSPPTVSTAYLPDSNGRSFSAAIMYAWLNDGLEKLSRAAGGLLDYCGVPTVPGQPLYTIPGNWMSITDVWYGGYWIQGGKRGDFFRRNTVTSNVLQSAAISISTDRQVIEVSYQPDRASGVTATTAGMTATDTQVAIGNTSAFLLPFGFAQIGTEIVAYSSLSGGLIGGLIRGVGNTVAQAWPSTTVVTELSLFWCGRRVFSTQYAPGNSSINLPIPVGWDTILSRYMLAQAKQSEQDMGEAKKLEDDAFQQARQWMNDYRPIERYVQVGGNNSPIVYARTPAGGLIIPG